MKPAADIETQSIATADVAMSRYADGDDGMFAVVYDAVAPRLEAYLQRNLRNQALVDDILQQTFMQMHAKRGTFEQRAQVLPWAFCIARNFMIDALRKSRHEAPADTAAAGDASPTWLVSAIATADQIVEAHQTKHRIVAAFAGLTDHQRAASSSPRETVCRRPTPLRSSGRPSWESNSVSIRSTKNCGAPSSTMKPRARTSGREPPARL
jgi:RNA polymerase sigma factor (sigma-70 family)